MDQGHWEGLKANPERFFGFIYLIEVIETGNAYVGKRQYWSAKQRVRGCKSRVFDRQSPRWKESCWVESEWRFYKGSSDHLHKFMQDNPNLTYKFTILENCRSRGLLYFKEAEYQWKFCVLTSKLPDGTFKYFNRAINGVKFRPKAEYSDESKLKISSRLKGNKNALGAVRSNETRKKISDARQGIIITDEQRGKISDTLSDKTIYSFLNSSSRLEFTGTRVEFTEKFCLNPLCVGRVISGKQKTTKGWCLV